MKRKLKLSKFKKPRDVVIIYYQWWAGGCNMRFWTAELNGDILNYQKKDTLIKQAEKAGHEWIIIRHHKKERGMITIVKYGGKTMQFPSVEK